MELLWEPTIDASVNKTVLIQSVSPNMTLGVLRNWRYCGLWNKKQQTVVACVLQIMRHVNGDQESDAT